MDVVDVGHATISSSAVMHIPSPTERISTISVSEALEVVGLLTPDYSNAFEQDNVFKPTETDCYRVQLVVAYIFEPPRHDSMTLARP
jgi:hypothetical protein